MTTSLADRYADAEASLAIEGLYPRPGQVILTRQLIEAQADQAKALGAMRHWLDRTFGPIIAEFPGTRDARNPYCYAGGHVLINKFGVNSDDLLSAYEYGHCLIRMAHLVDHRSGISPSAFRALHRCIFQDVYDWAGDDRTVNIGKGNSVFCHSELIAYNLDREMARFAEEGELEGLSRGAFAVRAAEHVGELNAIHPFREGNGRVLRAWLVQLGKMVGHPIRIAAIDAHEWMRASIESFQGMGCDRMTRVIEMATFD